MASIEYIPLPMGYKPQYPECPYAKKLPYSFSGCVTQNGKVSCPVIECSRYNGRITCTIHNKKCDKYFR